MYRKTKWITKRRGLCLLFFGFFLLTGCGSQLANYLPWWGQNSGKELQARLDEGHRLFKEGNYSAAESVFENLQETGNPDVIRPALYGLACSRFMLAESKEEFLDAVEILELWRRISPVSLEQEDPRMLLSIFTEGTFPRDSNNEAAGPKASEERFLMWFFDYEERIKALKEQVASLDMMITSCEEQNEDAMAEMQTVMVEMEAANESLKETLKAKEEAARALAGELSKLREQIKTFETIDQEIQEKKQGISSP